MVLLSILYSYNSREREDQLSLGNTHYESIPHLLLYYYYLRQSLHIAKDRLKLAVKPGVELRILLPHPTKLLGTGSLIFKCY